MHVSHLGGGRMPLAAMHTGREFKVQQGSKAAATLSDQQWVHADGYMQACQGFGVTRQRAQQS